LPRSWDKETRERDADKKMSDAHKKLKIVVACGTGIATSTHVAVKLRELLAQRGKENLEIVQCRVPEITNYVHDADLVISTAQVPFEISVPLFTNAIAFLTGIGVDELVDEIDHALDKR